MVLLMLAYVASPYITLWRLATALRHGDARTLQAVIDWDAVRGGLKEDVSEGLVGLPQEDDGAPQIVTSRVATTDALPAIDRGDASADEIDHARPSSEAVVTKAAHPLPDLPPFGASFMAGIAGNIIDREVTPQHLAALMRQMMTAEPPSLASLGGSLRSIEHAWFDGPASFEIRLRYAGQDEDDEPLRLRLELQSGGWRVMRAWVPQDLIERASDRT
jgi:hypothetical protein